jgi:hypothetical protein
VDEMNRGCWTVINGQPCVLGGDHTGDHQDASSVLRAVEILVRKAGPCGEAGCTSVATCSLKEALGWLPTQT